MSNSKYPKCGIYIITCTINDKHYIGKSNDIKRRLTKHKAMLNTNCHPNKHLQDSVNKYGIENFKFDILEEYPIDCINSMEHYWCTIIGTHDNKIGYNKLPTGPFGHTTHSEETKMKLSKSLKGNGLGIKRKPCSEEAKRKISEANKGNTAFKGRHHSVESKEKIRNAHKGKIYHLPIKHTEETKRRLSEMKKGIKFSEEAKRNMSKAKQGVGRVRIVQLDSNLNFIKEWSGIKFCADELGISSGQLCDHINGKYEQLGGFVFIKKTDYDIGILPKKPSFFRTRKTVLKIDILTGNVTQTYNSTREAAKDIVTGETYLGQICLNNKQYKGFIWKYKEN